MDSCVVSTMVNRAAVNVYAPPDWHAEGKHILWSPAGVFDISCDISQFKRGNKRDQLW